MSDSKYYSYEIEKEKLHGWLLDIYSFSELDKLEDAISIAKMYAETDKQRENIDFISVLFRAECSGELNPPVNMRECYTSIVKEKTLKEAS
jgi:hypothetical protein